LNPFTTGEGRFAQPNSSNGSITPFSWKCAIGELLRSRAIQWDFVKANLNTEEESE
jgi:hypothetical protein